MQSNRLNVLIVANQLSPIKGSESAVGWNIVTRLARYHNVTVLYASGSQFRPTSYVEVVKEYFLTAAPISGLTLINIDHSRLSKFIYSINSIFSKLSAVGLPLLFYAGYNYWQKDAFREAKRLHKINNFDIVHQLTLISFRNPGYLWKMDIPFFWGPTGMTTTLPKNFYKLLSWESKILERIRSVSNFYQFNYSSKVRNANKRANVIYTFSNADAYRLKKRASGQVKILLDVGTYLRPESAKTKSENNSMVTGIWCGKLTDKKAPSILLQALAQDKITKENIEFIIVGNGPLEAEIHKLADELGLKNIKWIREVQHKEIFDLMSQADFFVHTSLMEATSSVIPEALSVGLPVICHDINGMGIAINESCGITIPMKSPDESINGFHEAMKRLAVDSDLLEQLKTGAKKRSREISWDVIAQTIANDYESVATNKLK